MKMCRLLSEVGVVWSSDYRFLPLYVIDNDMRSSAITENCVLSYHLCSPDNIGSFSMTFMAKAVLPRSAALAIPRSVNFGASSGGSTVCQ